MEEVLKKITEIIENYNKIYKDIEEVESKLKNLSQEREEILVELDANRNAEAELLKIIKADSTLKKKLSTDNVLELYKQLLEAKITQ